MRVIWVGDAVVSTGFSRCTHVVCDELHRAGHEVSVLGINHHGNPTRQYPYDIFPCRDSFDGGFDDWGVSRLPRFIERYDPDVVVILQDCWNMRAYIEAIKQYGLDADSIPPIVGWIAVDAKNQVGHELNALAHVVTWTQFGIDELRKGGYEGTSDVVPLGVDTSVFYPRDREESRRSVCPPEFASDAFIVGVVGRNQPRKRLDLSIAYFAEWVQRDKIDNAYLFLHVAPTGDRGCDIRSLAYYYGLKGRVIVLQPDIGIGLPVNHMAMVYSAFDVCLTTTQGEGWGLCTAEAMACGCPCIVPAWSALGEWASHGAYQVPCTSTALNAPLNSLAYTIGGVPDKEATINALREMYSSWKCRDGYRNRGLALAARPEYQWQNVGIAFREVLERVVERVETEKVQVEVDAETELQEAVA